MLVNAVNIRTFERYNYTFIEMQEVFFLHYLIAKSAYFGNTFYYEDARIKQEVGLSEFQINRLRKSLVKMDLIHIKRGLQSKMMYFIYLEGIYNKIDLLIKPEFKAKFISELAELNEIYKRKNHKPRN